MRALVTGASGFVGSHLVEKLVNQGIEVRALLRKTSKTLGNLDGVKFEKAEGSLADEESLRRAVKDVDYIFHVAGVITAAKRDDYFESNERGTERLARAAAEVNPGLKRFVLVSSLAAGGPAASLESPKRESDTPAPVSIYGHSKLGGERAVQKYLATYPVSIVRPPVVYGPRDPGVFVIVQSVAKGLCLLPPGGAERKFYSMVHVQDLCDGIVLAGQTSAPSGSIYYVSDGAVRRYDELMDTIAARLGKKPLKVPVPRFVLTAAAAGLSGVGRIIGKSFPLNLDKVNELLPDFWICSNEKAKTELGFEPRYDLSKGMTDAIDWYKSHHWI